MASTSCLSTGSVGRQKSPSLSTDIIKHTVAEVAVVYDNLVLSIVIGCTT